MENIFKRSKFINLKEKKVANHLLIYSHSIVAGGLLEMS